MLFVCMKAENVRIIFTLNDNTDHKELLPEAWFYLRSNNYNLQLDKANVKKKKIRQSSMRIAMVQERTLYSLA